NDKRIRSHPHRAGGENRKTPKVTGLLLFNSTHLRISTIQSSHERRRSDMNLLSFKSASASRARTNVALAVVCPKNKNSRFRMSRTRMPAERGRPRTIALVAAAALLAAPAGLAQVYQQTNLVSDLPGMAAHTDSNLVNPWGIASSASSFFWVADNHMGVSTLYDSSGTPQSLVVTVPPAPGGMEGSPTGIVFNGSTDFEVSSGSPALFIFATEDGTISGWAASAGTTAIIKADNSASEAVYKG